jgi:polysaccharide deacetylase family protein (PEP-CTERM system associated)
VKQPVRILTFDLEDWFHILDHPATRYPAQWENFESRVERNTDRLLALLAQHGQRATFFCLGWVADRFPELIRRVADQHTIACHTYSHQLAYQQTPDDFRQDALRAKGLLEDITGRPVDIFRAAGFSAVPQIPWFFEELIACGFTADSSVFPMRRGHGGYPGFPFDEPCRVATASGSVLEFPMSSARLFGFPLAYSGGGYFRLMPYRLVNKWMSGATYTMTYFHPRDIDMEQPLLDSLSVSRKFKSYYGLKGCYAKLEQLLRDFRFSEMDTVRSLLSGNNLPIVEINADGTLSATR